MSRINRRDLFVGAGSLCAAYLTRHAGAATGGSGDASRRRRWRASRSSRTPISARRCPTRIAGWRTTRTREWLPFLKGQNAHARAVLDTTPGPRPADEAHRAAVGRCRQHARRAARRRPAVLPAAPGGRGQLQAVRARARRRPRAHRPDAAVGRGRPHVARLVGALAERLARGVRPVEGRQRGLGAARAVGRRRHTTCPSASPTPRTPARLAR